MISLVLRNLFFTALQPGLVAGLIPYWIVRHRIAETLDQSFAVIQYFGFTVLIIGLIIMIVCIGYFAFVGRGTLSPADQTKRLVTVGPYRFSRNPMYVGVMLILIGQSMITQLTAMWLYTLIVVIAFHTFTVLVEEPRLRKDFGEEYRAYCQNVRRWI